MAKENVAKFFEKLASDKALAEKLAAVAKEYSSKGDDEAALKAAAEAVILPLAKEAGFSFTAEELMAYHEEKQGDMEGEISDDEMANAAGGCFMPFKNIKEIFCQSMGIGLDTPVAKKK